MNVLILSGPNHNFKDSAVVIEKFLSSKDYLSVTLVDDKEILTSPKLNEFNVCVFGTGFTRTIRQKEGPPKHEPDLTPKQEEGLFAYVNNGIGLVGIHGTAWWIGGRAVDLIGGHANWHPPGQSFTVSIDDSEHPITRGLCNFKVDDEIYMSAWDPRIHILASAKWQDKEHPLAWLKPYGNGRVFYTTLGHGPVTFNQPGMQALIERGVLWAGGRN